jgi:hypothetical protein
MDRRRRLPPLATALLAAALSGCRAPTRSTSGDPVAGAQKLLALEFSQRQLVDLEQKFDAGPGWLQRELLRIDRTHAAKTIGNGMLRRSRRIDERAGELFARETRRRPHVPTLYPPMTPQRVVDGVDRTAEFLLFGHDPLGEPSDRRHRTELDDDRDEATFWQRIRRRLRL